MIFNFRLIDRLIKITQLIKRFSITDSMILIESLMKFKLTLLNIKVIMDRIIKILDSVQLKNFKKHLSDLFKVKTTIY